VVAERSEESRELQAYYARVQNDLKSRGLLRVDGGGPDTPYGRAQLVDNFIRIALFEEFASVGGLLVAQQTASQLHRWSGPVRMSVRFGDSVTLKQRSQDAEAVSSYAARLARLTGSPVSVTCSPSRANFHEFLVNENARLCIGDVLRASIPDH